MLQERFARRAAVAASLTAALAVGVTPASAGVLMSFTGLNLVYDGSSIRDAGSPVGGFADPADADPLGSVDFFFNNMAVAGFSANISLDVFIPGVTNIPFVQNSAHNIVTTGDSPGFIDLLIGTSPLASEFLLLRVEQVSLTFLDIAGQAQFLFSGAVASIDGQNLPFGLELHEPAVVSFSVQIDPGSLTTADGFVTGFTASGTGEISQGAVIPAPGPAAALTLLGAAAIARRRR